MKIGSEGNVSFAGGPSQTPSDRLGGKAPGPCRSEGGGK